MGFSLIVAFILYILAMLAIGFFASSYNKSSEDFHLGGRRVNYWVTAISAHASDMSSWLFMAFPFLVYSSGLFQSWIPIGLIVGMWANWHFISPRLRARSEELKSETIPDFLSKSVQDKHGVIKYISCLFCIFFFLFYIASGLKGIGFLLNNLFNFPVEQGVFLSALIIMVYVAVGGFFAVSFVGAFQGIFLLVMLLLVPFGMKAAVGTSWLSFFTEAAEYFHKDVHSKDFFQFDGIFLAMSWGLGYFGMIHVLSKFMGVDSVKNLKKSRNIGFVWQTLALGSSLCFGILAKAYFHGASSTEDLLFIQIVREVFPTFIAGLVFCAMLAATISTVDSQIMVASTSLTKDVLGYEGKKSVHVSRISIFLLTMAAASVAAFGESSIQALVNYAWMGQGASFGPLVIAVLFFKPLNATHAAIGMFIGAGLSSVLPFTSLPFHTYPMIPGFFLSLLYLFVASQKNNQTASK